jgi:hypothetical protein
METIFPLPPPAFTLAHLALWAAAILSRAAGDSLPLVRVCLPYAFPKAASAALIPRSSVVNRSCSIFNSRTTPAKFAIVLPSGDCSRVALFAAAEPLTSGALRRRSEWLKLNVIKAKLQHWKHHRTSEVGTWLRKVVQGYYQYHAVPGNTGQTARLEASGMPTVAERSRPSQSTRAGGLGSSQVTAQPVDSAPACPASLSRQELRRH